MTLVLDLPMPPSVNAIWRSTAKRGKPQYYLDAKYKAWKKECDALVWVAGATGAALREPVTVAIYLNASKRRGDADNRIKAVLDWLQRARIIVNDSQVEKVSAEWGEAPSGCRVTIEAVA